MLWWVNGVIHRKNSFATFPAKLHTSEATLSFKNYKQKNKNKNKFQVRHAPFTVPFTSKFAPFHPSLFLSWWLESIHQNQAPTGRLETISSV